MAELVQYPRHPYVVSGRRGTSDPLQREETYRLIRALWQEGLSDNGVALRVGVSTKTVLRFRKKHGLATNFNIKWRTK